MTEDERNLLLTVATVMRDQMKQVAEASMRSVGMVRGPIREHLPKVEAALKPFETEPEPVYGMPGSQDCPEGFR